MKLEGKDFKIFRAVLKMDAWMVGHEISRIPPFLTRNLSRTPGTIRKRPVESECASFTVKGIPKSLFASGYITNNGIRVPVTIQTGVPVVTFSCFDEVHLHCIDPKKGKMYSIQFICCRNWGIKNLKAVGVPCVWFSGNGLDRSDSIEVCVEITDLRRSKEYHYNIPERSSRHDTTFMVLFNGNRVSLRTYECPCCYFRFNEMNTLKDHLDLVHKRIWPRISDGKLHLSVNAGFPSMHNSSWEIACEGKKLLSGGECNPLSRMDPVGHSGEIIDWHRTKKVCNGTGVVFKCDGCKDFAYLRKRDTELMEYPLSGYGLLINREFDTLDYSAMVSNHLNLGLEEKRLSLDQIEYKIMREWNHFRAGGLDAEECLCKVIAMHSLSHSVIKLISILYTRGLLSSKDILGVLEKTKSDAR